MPAPKKKALPVDFTVFASPLDAAPDCAASVDVMLGRFQEGLFNSGEGKRAFEEIKGRETYLLGALDPLYRAGLAGGALLAIWRLLCYDGEKALNRGA